MTLCLWIVNLWKNVSSCTTNTWEIFDHGSLLQNIFWYLPNWTSTNLWCVVLYVTYSATHYRGWLKFSLADNKKKFQEWSMVKNLSWVSCAAWNVFSINSLMPGISSLTVTTSFFKAVRQYDRKTKLQEIVKFILLFYIHVWGVRKCKLLSYDKLLYIFFFNGDS